MTSRQIESNMYSAVVRPIWTLGIQVSGCRRLRTMCKEEREASAATRVDTTYCARRQACEKYDEDAAESRRKPRPWRPPRTCVGVLADMIRVSEGTEGCDALKQLHASMAYVPPELFSTRFWCGYGAQPGLQSICQTHFKTDLRVRNLYNEAYRITVSQKNIH